MDMKNNRLILLRTSKFSKRTLGYYLVVDKWGRVVYKCYCLELPWKGNKKYISCVPVDIYPLVKVEKSNSFNYPHFWIKDVPKRTGIKIHIANETADLQGCQAPGLKVKDFNKDGIIDVLESTEALEKLLCYLPSVTTIEIIESCG